MVTPEVIYIPYRGIYIATVLPLMQSLLALNGSVTGRLNVYWHMKLFLKQISGLILMIMAFGLMYLWILANS